MKFSFKRFDKFERDGVFNYRINLRPLIPNVDNMIYDDLESKDKAVLSLYDWFDTNNSGRWTAKIIKLRSGWHFPTVLLLQLEEDYVMFKLRWL